MYNIYSSSPCQISFVFCFFCFFFLCCFFFFGGGWSAFHFRPIAILPAARVSPLLAAILCLLEPGFPVPGLLLVGCKMCCSHMSMAYLSYELSLYNTAKMTERSGDTRAVHSIRGGSRIL